MSIELRPARTISAKRADISLIVVILWPMLFKAPIISPTVLDVLSVAVAWVVAVEAISSMLLSICLNDSRLFWVICSIREVVLERASAFF